MRTADAALTSQTDREAQAVFDVVDGLRKPDVASQLKRLRAKRLLAVQARSHPSIIQAFDEAIEELEQRDSLAALPPAKKRVLDLEIRTAQKLPVRR